MPARGIAGLKDVAARTGLSVSVVSRALNPHPDKNARVAEETRKWVLNVAGEMGFRRNRSAEFMKRGGVATIGVFLPASPNRLVADLVFGIAEVLEAEDFPMQISFDNFAEGFRRFLEHNMDLSHSGVISYPSLVDDPKVEAEVKDYCRGKGRMVLLNTALRLDDVPVVAMDEELGGRMAAEQLLERGCGQFCVVGKCMGRQKGFHSALADAGRKGNEFNGDPDGLKRLASFCRGGSEDRPVGVFAVTDILALRVMRALSGGDARVGTEVLLVGYDDLDLTGETTPSLTTIHQPFREEGRMAARKLINLIYGGKEDPVLISPRLVARESA